MKLAHLLLASALFGHSPAFAQSPIFGIDLRYNRFFQTDTSDFVGNFQSIATVNSSYEAIDFDATASTLYVIRRSDSVAGILHTGSGSFTSLGLTSFAPDTVAGLTADPDGVTWWVVANDPTSPGSSGLFRGDILTGVFQYVGIIVQRPATILPDDFIDIACSLSGQLYGFSIKDDSLYSIDRNTGAGTLIGASGYPAQYSQGMDFDWATDTLYATLYNSGGAGVFVSFQLTTGQYNLLQLTAPLDAEMEMAVQFGITPNPGTPFCDPADANSTGVPTHLFAVATPGQNAAIRLEAQSGPPNQFAYFLVGTAAQDPGTAISQGHLCLAVTSPNLLGRYNILNTSRNSLGRFDAAGILQNLVGTATSGSGSGFDVPTVLPFPGSPTLTSGSTYHFQLWFRESGGASNFSNGLTLSF